MHQMRLKLFHVFLGVLGVQGGRVRTPNANRRSGKRGGRSALPSGTRMSGLGILGEQL